MSLGAWQPIETLQTPPGARFHLIVIGLSVVMFAPAPSRGARQGHTSFHQQHESRWGL